MMTSERVLGVIGGSGVSALERLSGPERLEIATPWGAPSGPVVSGRLNGVSALFLARHGEGHRLTPSAVNYRANIDALKRAGATDIVSISACGSLREDIRPGDFVIVDQYVDRTSGRANSFFGEGFVAHVSMANPVCSALSAALARACADAGISHRRGGVYVCMEGPQFSTRAESRLYRAWGCDVVGMTNMPEARLAREAELPYASVAMATDYDCWRESEKPVEVADVIAVMKANAANAGRLLDALTKNLGSARTPSPDGIETALDFAVITAPEAQDPAMVSRLDAVAGRYLRRAGRR